MESRNGRPRVQAETQDRILQGMDRFGFGSKPGAGSQARFRLQNRRWPPFDTRPAYRSPVFGLSMAGCDGFANDGERRVLQKRRRPPSALANPVLPATRFCKAVTGCHGLLQTRLSLPSRFAKPSQPAISGAVFEEREQKERCGPFLREPISEERSQSGAQSWGRKRDGLREEAPSAAAPTRLRR